MATVKIDHPLVRISAIIQLVIIVWILHILFLPHVVNLGMHIEDWEWLFYFDAYNGDFFAIKNNIVNIHGFQQSYYIGTLKTIFGINQVAFQLTTLLWKSLAALSTGFLVFKLTKDKLCAFLTVYFFIILPSTAGLFVAITGLNYLIAAFMSFSIYFYIQSIKKPKKILLASLFFFLTLSSGPGRAYILLPVPLIVELIRLKMRFRPFEFIQKLIIFYFLPFLFLQSHETGSQFQFRLIGALPVRLKHILSGNLYTFTLPFQMVSTLFIDKHILKQLSGISGFLIINIFLTLLSFFLGVIIKRERIWFFIVKVMLFTLALEAIFYLFGILSIRQGVIYFASYYNSYDLSELLYPSVFQASLGGYIFILGLLLTLEWWKNQRENKILMVAAFAWFWFFISEFVIFITQSWWLMLEFSNDRYIFISSVGAVVFIAAIFTLSFRAFEKITNWKFKLICFLLFGITILLITYKEYELLNQLYNDFSRNAPVVYPEETSYWQETMYQRFLNKFGKENLRKPALIFIDDSQDNKFNMAAFKNPIKYRIYYDENGNLIRENQSFIIKDEGMVRRDNCKEVVSNFNKIKEGYTIYNGERGFVYDYTNCVKPKISEDKIYTTNGIYNIFYPLNNFYAYKIVNKEFVDIKDEIISEFDQSR